MNTWAMTNEDWREVGRSVYPWIGLFVLVGGLVMADTIRSGKPKRPLHDIRTSQTQPSVNVQASRVP